jgi:hypothetical protein
MRRRRCPILAVIQNHGCAVNILAEIPMPSTFESKSPGEFSSEELDEFQLAL